jgi:hypothetical protein
MKRLIIKQIVITVTMMMIAKHHLPWSSFHQDLINQLNTFILNDEERESAEFLVGVLWYGLYPS